MTKPILCLDFDGVLHSYLSGWKGAAVIPDPPVDGAIEFILEAMGDFQVAIFSSRSHQWGGRRAIKRWLREQLALWKDDNELDWTTLPHYDQDYGAPPGYDEDLWVKSIVSRIKFPFFKPPAMISLDDRALQFTGTWPTIKLLKSFKPWNKQAI